jgi:hypothetical protein
VRAAIEEFAVVGALARPTICDLEIGYSARNEGEWDRLIGALDAFEAIQRPASASAEHFRSSDYLRSKANADERSQICSWRRPPKNMT